MRGKESLESLEELGAGFDAVVHSGFGGRERLHERAQTAGLNWSGRYWGVGLVVLGIVGAGLIKDGFQSRLGLCHGCVGLGKWLQLCGH